MRLASFCVLLTLFLHISSQLIRSQGETFIVDVDKRRGSSGHSSSGASGHSSSGSSGHSSSGSSGSSGSSSSGHKSGGSSSSSSSSGTKGGWGKYNPNPRTTHYSNNKYHCGYLSYNRYCGYGNYYAPTAAAAIAGYGTARYHGQYHNNTNSSLGNSNQVSGGSKSTTISTDLLLKSILVSCFILL